MTPSLTIMHRIRLIHWNRAEAEERAAALRAAGYEVISSDFGPGSLREIRESRPNAVVIDLTRIPSQGRDVAIAIRVQKATRQIPLVLVGGDPGKIKKIREQLPGAAFASWNGIGAALDRAIAEPPAATDVPTSNLAGYSGAPLAKKLGIKANSVVALIHAPRGFKKTLGDLPEGVKLRTDARGRANLTIWFTKSKKELERAVERMVRFSEHGGLWIAWPKQTSPIAGDLREGDVRRAGLAAGMVDFKICAIDADWSGLRAREPEKPLNHGPVSRAREVSGSRPHAGRVAHRLGRIPPAKRAADRGGDLRREPAGGLQSARVFDGSPVSRTSA